MSDNTPLTLAPVPLLANSPNIETAVNPAVRHLERFVIPRFATNGARNRAFQNVTPAVGQMVFVESRGPTGYDVWNGSAWEEFGSYTRTREFSAWKSETSYRTSTQWAAVPEMSLPITPGIWKVEVDLIYRTEGSDTNIGVGFTFPGAASTASIGVQGRGSNATGGNLNASTYAHDVNSQRVSGAIDSLNLGGRGMTDALGARMFGTVNCQGTGTLQLTYRRQGAAGTEVAVWTNTTMSIRRIA